MQSPSMNPLAKHFRQPAINIALPSKGEYWPDGSIEIPLTGEIPVYPMTTRDEITIRTPDALLNGEGIVSIIQSCCPNIKDAWKMPSIDVDATLIAIRIASYGQEMDIDSTCTNDKCKHENRHGLDLSMLLSGIKAPNYNTPIEINGLKIKLRPQSYFENNKTNMSNFEEQRVMQVINDDSITDDVKVIKFKEHMNKLIDININIITAGTEYIEVDGEQVDNPEFIKEFYSSADGKVVRTVRDQFDEYAKQAQLPTHKVFCEECSNEYSVEVTFNYVNFFAAAS